MDKETKDIIFTLVIIVWTVALPLLLIKTFF